MGWSQLPQNYLEKAFDSLGLERRLESGIMDTAERTERLSDYPDPRSSDDDFECEGSRQPLNHDEHPVHDTNGWWHVRCAVCGLEVRLYSRKGVRRKKTH